MFGGGGGSNQECLYCLNGYGEGWGRQNAYVKDLDSYPPKNGVQVCEMYKSLTTAHIIYTYEYLIRHGENEKE